MYPATLIRMGSIKSKALKSMEVELMKRLSSFTRLRINEVKSSAFKSALNRERVFTEEAKSIEHAWEEGSFKIILSETGATMTSEVFAKKLDDWSDNGQRSITFVVGSALGVSRELMQKANFTLSLSPMTFPHEYASILLLEQLYRAGTIKAGKTYHY